MTEPEIARAIGERLRAIRKRMRLSLHDVEAMTEQEFKASSLGTYERGERDISAVRLQRLAEVYGVPVEQILSDAAGKASPASSGVSIDLTKLHTVRGPERDLLLRFVSMIQVHRQDFNGRTMRIRTEDVRAIACLCGVTPDSMAARLDEIGVLG